MPSPTVDTIPDLPIEIYQHIFRYLDTEDLLTLRFVCAGFHEYAFVILINRHRGFLQRYIDYLAAVAFGNFNHDTQTTRLGMDALNTSIMHCVASLGQISEADFTVLKHFIALSANLVHFRFDSLPRDEGESQATHLHFTRGLLLAFAGSRSHTRVPSILVLSPTYGFVRSRRRAYGYPNMDIHAAVDSDPPPATEAQKAQIKRDLSHVIDVMEPKSLQMYTLELPSTFDRHILVVENHEDIQQLNISTEVVPQAMWENLLRYMNLPRLTAVHVQRDLNLPMSVLTQFLWRHPNITQLTLKQGSISPPITGWPPLEHLKELEASLWFVKKILVGVDLGVLRALRIGGAVSIAAGEPAETLRYEGGFDFRILDDVLHGLANSALTMLEIMIPGRSVSRGWLWASARESEPRLMNVERALVYTDYAFTLEVFDLLKIWMKCRFPEMECKDMPDRKGLVAQSRTHMQLS
ncbi:hypothetical protein Hypma_005021 [Hypsizygus marmoreus]|uniref:F-box domain-containing protein n=1 Tax=Hypsizygus marmoreus TaxID=39966 RepID=A0A369K7Q1_HYPMA|nr:hypothetical protein Hypma_005021 [Hypsizygus marmoreus]